MSIDEERLQEIVDRKAKPIMRMIYHGSAFAIGVLLLIMAALVQAITWQTALIIGTLLLASVMLHGVWFGAQMARLGIEEEEREKLLKEAEFYGEKAKRDRLVLSDDGELVDYPALEEERKHMTSG